MKYDSISFEYLNNSTLSKELITANSTVLPHPGRSSTTTNLLHNLCGRTNSKGICIKGSTNIAQIKLIQSFTNNYIPFILLNKEL